MNSIDKVNKLSKSEFISIFGNIFEKTVWIAEKAYYLKPFKNTKELIFNLIKIFENSQKESHLKILNAHPELVVGEKLTSDSKKEQNNASLDQCLSEEFKEFKELNEEYKKKFGFPFIIAVKGKDRKKILKNFRERVKNNLDLEFLEAKEQVKKIATFRLDDIVK